MKRIKIHILTIIIACGIFSSCKDYLDIVPEGVPSIDNIFSNRANAKKFLYTCYSYLPFVESPGSNAAFLSGDECWLIPKGTGQIETRLGLNPWEIGRGSQNSNSPYLNFWDGGNTGTNLWVAIRDCNIFLEEIYTPQDLESYERDRWIAEVTFLKAYYHFYLLQMYGPIPITDKNVLVNASIDEVRVFRDPVDDVVDYITKTMDKAAAGMSLNVLAEAAELGRITRTIALAQKAKVLAFAASPLLNGNTDYENVKDSKGRNLFPTTYDPNKWVLAAEAAKVAIETADSAGRMIYTYEEFVNISDVTRTKMNIRESVCDRWNDEIIWGSTFGSSGMQILSMPKLSSTNNHWSARSLLAPTMRVAEQFYSSNGVPISEDNSAYWTENYNKRFEVTKIPDTETNRYNLKIGDNTAKLHLEREPRFYATLGFDRGMWYSSDDVVDTLGTIGTSYLSALNGEYSGARGSEDYSITGYFAKKICSYRNSITKDNFTTYAYSFPIIRLADIYLLYAEARNETLNSPDAEVYKYVDAIRERAGLDGVVQSWADHSRFPTKATTKEGMREIIRQERLNELALEGQRFWDLRRWKERLPSKIQGWNVKGSSTETYYRLTTVFERSDYGYRDFLWPLQISSLQKNPNLVQNPGW